MRSGRRVQSLMSNEARALLPTWIAAVLAGSVAAGTDGEVHNFSQVAFAAATIALGAQSMGHEYSHRTLGLMLMLPVDRRQLLLVKLAVAAVMVLPLAVYASRFGLFTELPALPPWLIAAVALCLAPSLTMLCRSQLAGTIFSMSVPWIAFISVLIVTRTTFEDAFGAERAAFQIWSRLMVPVLAASAALGWWLFMRLEWLEAGGTGCHLKWRTRTPQDVRPRHPLWQLVRKEFRLQQMTFAITAVYLTSCAAAVVFDIPGPEARVSFTAAATVVYVLGLPALVGSLATAEERQLGTLGWQLLLPAPAWQQWAVKAGTVFGLTLLMSIGLPLLVVWPTERPPLEMPVVLAIVMTAVSMYVSSLCATAVRAVVTSVVAVAFVLWLILKPELWIGREGVFVTLLSVAVVLLLRFAFLNHRPELPAAARIWRQTLSLAALMGFGLLMV